MAEKNDKGAWYVVHTYSGYENKVKTNLEKAIENQNLEDQIFEIKIDYGPGYRVYYALQGQSIVLLLCGGSKRTQSADIKNAVEYWRDYLRRKK